MNYRTIDIDKGNQKFIKICQQDFNQFYAKKFTKNRAKHRPKIEFLNTAQLKEKNYRYNIFIFDLVNRYDLFIAYVYDINEKKFIYKFVISRGA